jgi:hypothetical protein
MMDFKLVGNPKKQLDRSIDAAKLMCEKEFRHGVGFTCRCNR